MKHLSYRSKSGDEILDCEIRFGLKSLQIHVLFVIYSLMVLSIVKDAQFKNIQNSLIALGHLGWMHLMRFVGGQFTLITKDLLLSSELLLAQSLNFSNHLEKPSHDW